IALAKAFADQGRRVLLVDADMRKPSLHRVLQQSNKIGLSTLLSGDTPLSSAAIAVPALGLDFVPSGPRPLSPVLLLTAPLRARLAEMRGAYDVVVLDGPPIIGLSDAPLLSDAAEMTIFVIEANRTRTPVARSAIRRLGGNVAGVVLTKFDPQKAGASYSYDYLSYQYGYGRTNA